MLIDRTAALSKLDNLREEISQPLYKQVRDLIIKKSRPGSVGRSVFDLNEFLSGLAAIQFNNRYDTAKLFEYIGVCLATGLIVASYEDNR